MDLQKLLTGETLVNILQLLMIAGFIFVFVFIPSNIYRHMVALREEAVVLPVTEMPEGTIQFEKPGGENLGFDVRVANTDARRMTGFDDTEEQDIRENILLCIYAFDNSTPRRVVNVPVALDLAFFARDGSLLAILQPEVGSEAPYGPDERYRFVLMARRGFLEENGITEDSDIRLIPGQITIN